MNPEARRRWRTVGRWTWRVVKWTWIVWACVSLFVIGVLMIGTIKGLAGALKKEG